MEKLHYTILASKLFDNEEMNSCIYWCPQNEHNHVPNNFPPMLCMLYTVFLTFPYSDLREHVLAMWSQCVLILF